MWMFGTFLATLVADVTSAVPGKHGITLTWRAPESGPEVAGYYIYARRHSGEPPGTGEELFQPGQPFQKIDVGNVTQYRLEGLDKGRWSFAATAFNAYGLESDFSNVFTIEWLDAPRGLGRAD